MFRKPWMAVAFATFVTGCNVAKSADQAEREALARRVAELEQKLAETEQQSPAPAETRAPQTAAAPSRRQPVRAALQATPAPRVASSPAVEPPLDRAAADPVRVAPTSRPVPPIVIEAGTTLELVLESSLSSRSSRAGDKIAARIEGASAPDGSLALPGGSYLEGRVVESRPSGRVKGKARVALSFDQIVVRGQRHAIETSSLSFEADGSQKRDAAIVAGSAAAGAIVGAITGGSVKKGAVLGGAAGGGAVLATKGKEVELPAGSPASVRVIRERVIGR